MEKSIQLIIINNLIHDRLFAQKAFPHLKKKYFENENKIVYSLLRDHAVKYRKIPNASILEVELLNNENLASNEYVNDALFIIQNELNEKIDVDFDWLIDTAEKWCQTRSMYLAVIEAFDIVEGNDTTKSPGIIPSIMTDALKVTFNNDVGHDYFEDASKRHEMYRHKEKKLPFDIEIFNKITNNGVELKSLNIILAPTGVGKSLVMCHLAAHYLSQGLNVVYITLEMAEEKIAQRIDANLFDIEINDIPNLSKEAFEKKVMNARKKSSGNLFVKEYPTGGGTVTHFQTLLDELKLKKNFVADVVFIDYLNLCDSVRMNKQGGSYEFVKCVAEETRGFAVVNRLPVWTATQTNRDGHNNSDISLKNTSESWGVPATADFMMALISNEELENLNQMMIKQLKNRYNGVSYYPKFLVGIDKAKSKIYELEDDQAGLVSSESYEEDPVSQLAKQRKTKKKGNYEGFIT